MPTLLAAVLVGAVVVLVLGSWLVETLARRVAPALPAEAPVSELATPPPPPPPPGCWCCCTPPASPFESFIALLGQLHPGPGWHHQELTLVMTMGARTKSSSHLLLEVIMQAAIATI